MRGSTVGRIVVAAAGLFAAALAAHVETASACSCSIGDPRRALVRADAAFVGVLVATRPAGEYQAIYTFRVLERIKGNLPETIDVGSADSSAACGIATEAGVPIGLLLSRSGSAWYSTLCAQLHPETLRRAARPLPAPTGSGFPLLLAGGSFGEARLLALDSLGRTIAYGRGAGQPLRLSVCPGGKRLAELAISDDARTVVLAVRTLPALKRLREIRLPVRTRGVFALDTSSLSCRDPRGEGVLVFVAHSTGPLSTRRADSPNLLIRVRGRTIVSRVASPAYSVAFAGRVAYLVEGKYAGELVRLDLATGKRERVTRLPSWTGPLVPSPDGRRLAGLVYRTSWANASRAVIVDLGARFPAVVSAALPRADSEGSLGWLDNRRLALLLRYGQRIVVYDTALRAVASVDGWEAWEGGIATIAGGTAYGVLGSRLQAARLPQGPVRRLPGRLPTAVVSTLVAAPR